MDEPSQKQPEGNQKKASTRAWRARNKEHIAEYNRRYRAENPEIVRQASLASRQRLAPRKRREHNRRVRARKYYEANADRIRIYNREWRARRRALDPEGYRRAEAERKRLWRQANRDRDIARKREYDKADPASARDRAREYHRRNAAERNATKRQYFELHPEKRREYQERWREKDRRRKAAGLPNLRLHRTPAKERAANQFAADAFFSREPTDALRQRILAELGTPQRLLDALRRANYRARAADYAARHPETNSDVVDRRTAEEKRLDELARLVNERLRVNRRAGRSDIDPAAPHQLPNSPQTPGLSR